MNPGTRAITAAVVRIMKKNHMIDRIEDRSQGKKISISGTLSAKAIDIYDHSRICHVNVTVDGHHATLHDHKTGKYLTMTISGTTFSGYDSGSSKNFSGSIRDTTIDIYDSEDGHNHVYAG